MPPDATLDEQDVLEEASTVAEALAELGHETADMAFSLDLVEVSSRLRALKPDFVFNLVESVEGAARLVYLAPALLDFLKIPYSGCPTEAIFNTGNKLLTKRTLQTAGIPTAPWVTLESLDHETTHVGSWIVKSVWEHASVGLSDESVVAASQLPDRLRRACGSIAGDSFAEVYIHGREFNVSMLGGPGGPRVLPVAEMTFVDYPEGKPRIVDYRAKWDEESFEYTNTVRAFDFGPGDSALIERLRQLSEACWKLCQLRGYGRVDFRVDDAGRPWVLEVNTNPCISRHGGFLAAAAREGFRPAEVVARIITDSAPGLTCR